MTEPVGVAVAGIGNAGAEHLAQFAAHPDARVVAIVDRDRSRAEAAGAGAGVECAIYPTLDEALARDDLDAVVVATPTRYTPR